MQKSKSTIAILAAIVMIATTTTVLNNRLPSQQAYASQCNTFEDSQTGTFQPPTNANGGCSSQQSLDSGTATFNIHNHVKNVK
jgi:hypothetical protein